MEEEFELDEETKEILRKYQHEGISYEVDWDAEQAKDLDLLAIHWRPGDPNPLAQSIIDEVKERVGLILDGHRYWIEPQ